MEGVVIREYFEALQVWNWIQFQLPPAIWFQAQAQVIGPAPTPQEPNIAAHLANLQSPATPTPQVLAILADLLTIIKAGPQQ